MALSTLNIWRSCRGFPAESRALSSPVSAGDRPWRILLLIKCLDHGGAERLLVDMAAQGDRTSFDYEAAYVLDEHDGLSSAMRSTGTPVHSLGARSDWDLKWMATFRRLLVDGRYDLVRCHSRTRRPLAG